MITGINLGVELLKAYEKGAQSKQSEIDELKQKYKVLYDREVEKHDENLVLKAHINELRCNRIVSDGEIDELRKRIDEAIAMADESCGVNIPAFVKLNKILKGKTNEQ